MQTTRRYDEIDFWRGFVLVTIFVNHIPGNVFGYVTPRNFAFSDAAEAFVFLSGLSVALAYARKFAADPPAATGGLWRRAGHLYLVHVVLALAGMALYAVAYELTEEASFLLDDGRELPLLEPARGLIGILTLGHQPGYYNILPLYIVLVAATPLMLLVAARSRWLLLVGSLGLYAAARATGTNLPSWPTAQGGFYFNPLTWQIVYVIGLWVGLRIRQQPIPFLAGPWRVAVAVTLVSALVVSNLLGLSPGLVDAAGVYLDWDKSFLGTVRLFNFLCLAYVLYHSPVTAMLRATPVFAPLALLGRNSLAVFCAGTLLSSVGTILTQTHSPSIAIDLGLVVVGTMIMHGLATLIEWQGKTRPSKTDPR